MKKWLLNNFTLKMISLSLAVITWIYIQEILRYY